MKKNENIFISLEIKKNAESKGLLLSVQFDRNAPNFFQENETFTWSPTHDELYFIKEAFGLMGGNQGQWKEKEEPQEEEEAEEEEPKDSETSFGMDTTEYSHRSSEIRIAPLPNDTTLEIEEDMKSSNQKNKEEEEKIFIQADEKKIDEILHRKKQATKQQFNTDPNAKIMLDRMMKQKKKK
ncbi:MAG: hypothetical protein BV459_02290 [Thermoplasmata archaeon M11B2D]|nr:MAG: hypothetical protein BV459_02290 [Thermoplasmata archaeon M11B2D]PNX52967.1 MAG: hypothetical protein BV458_06920 [Thermoplasmata archaeon M9B2D]